MIIQTWAIRSNRIHSLKYLTSTKSDCKDIDFRKSEFVTKTQFLYSDLPGSSGGGSSGGGSSGGGSSGGGSSGGGSSGGGEGGSSGGGSFSNSSSSGK